MKADRRMGPGDPLALLVHLLAHGWLWVLEAVLVGGECWTCCSCEVVFRPTLMMWAEDWGQFRNCPECEGLRWGAWRTNTPSWWVRRLEEVGN